MKDSLDILTGYAFSSKNFNEEEGIPLIRIRDLETHNPKTLYKGDYDGRYIINKLDVLVGMDGEFNITRWKGPKSLLNQRVAKISSKKPDLLIKEFIYYRLESELKKIEALTPATTVKHLSKKDIEELELLIPPVQEQKKIISILSSVDEAIEKTEAIIKQTEEVKKGLMQQLLTKGIGHTRFKKTEIGKVPEIWDVKKVEEMGTVGTGGTPKRDEPKNYSGSIPWIKTTEIKYNLIMKSEEYITEYALGNSSAKLYPVGTVLLAMYGQGVTRGRCAILGIDAATNQACAAIVTNQEMINKFLYYVLELNYENLRNLGHGSNQSNLNTRFVKSFLVPVPPIHEQENIIKIISSVESKLMIEIRNLEELKKIKIGLMQSLLTGKVRVKVDENEVKQV